jgi:DNA-binding transcriptional MerR regulator/methylmalonyl-CoA mutase cobalamin-binding subunit
MHTVRWVAEQLGLAPGTLRAWEQRYGIVHPTRSEGGYRLYDDDDVAALRAMVALVEDGMQPAQAAEQVRSDRIGSIRGNAADPPSGLPDPAALIAASRAYDARALDDILDRAFASAGFEYVVDEWLTGALDSIGQGWADGRLDVAQEHFISAGVMRRLAAAFDAAGNSRAGRHVVIGLAPGATHEIATLAFATMLRRRGLRVTYLGPDLPVSSWVRAAGEAHPEAMVVGAPRVADADAAQEVVHALLEAAPHTRVYAGGPGATPGRELTGTTLAASADWLEDALSVPAVRDTGSGRSPRAVGA